jgi:hypothetical protein
MASGCLHQNGKTCGVGQQKVIVCFEHFVKVYASETPSRFWAEPPCGLDIAESHVGKFLPQRGQEDSAQGFNPGNRHPERRALKGRQIERTNNAKVGSKLYTSQLRTLVFAQQ